MEPKKNPSRDLARKRNLFFNLALTITLCMVITAFEWKFYDEGQLVNLGSINDDFEEMLEIPPTDQPPPPPPKIQQPKIIELPNEEKITEEIQIDLDIEITNESRVEEIIIKEIPPEEEVEEIFTIVEEMPTYPGGEKAFLEYVLKNLHYTEKGLRMGIEGRVFVQFVVGKDGELSEIEIVRGIGAGLDEEAAKLIESSSPWKPGKQRGKPVKTRIIVPIKFTLN